MNEFSERVTEVRGYKEAVLATMELKKLNELKQDITLCESNQDELSVLCGKNDSAEERERKIEKLHSLALESRVRLTRATQSIEELSAPLEYGDRKVTELFAKYFGLEFKVTEDHAISFSFSKLNVDDPEQMFTITMDIEEDKWKVVHMSPVLHGVRVHLDELNDGGGDLKTFCKQIRQKFKETLKEQFKTEQ